MFNNIMSCVKVEKITHLSFVVPNFVITFAATLKDNCNAEERQLT